MMIKTRLSTIIEDSWTSIYNYENQLHFCVNIFYSKNVCEMVQILCYYLLQCLNVVKEPYSSTNIFWCFQLKYSGFKFLLPYYNYQIIKKKKKVHSMFGTYLCNGRAHNQCAYEGKDGCSSKRSRGRNINGQVMLGLTMNPSFLGE